VQRYIQHHRVLEQGPAQLEQFTIKTP
jgi:hypothetical protein